jgi:magnesium chelatase family protein
VLFLDELPEFARRTLDMVHGVMVEGSVKLHREHCQLRVPAKFRLIASANPCPCGGHKHCVCTPGQIERYQARIPGWIRKMCRVVGPEEYGQKAA